MRREGGNHAVFIAKQATEDERDRTKITVIQCNPSNEGRQTL